MALHHSTEYNINGGAWILAYADEEAGPEKSLVPVGAVNGDLIRLRIAPLTGGGSAIISDPVVFVATGDNYVYQNQSVQIQQVNGLSGYIGAGIQNQTQVQAAISTQSFVGNANESQLVQNQQAAAPAVGYTGVASEIQSIQTQNINGSFIQYATVVNNQAKNTELINGTLTFSGTLSSVQGIQVVAQNGSVALPDTTAPVVTAFTVGTPSGSTVPITTFTATDAVGVAGYLITESATTPLVGAAGWTGTAPTSYTAVGSGSVTLYAWAKDATGNVSAAATQTVTIAAAPSGPFTMDFSTGAQGLTDSLGTQWDKVVPTDVNMGAVGSIVSNQSGGYAGNCMVVTPSIYDDGDTVFDYLPTYITRTAVTINAGTITFRAKRTATLVKPYISINGTITSFTPTVGSWIQCSVNVPSTLTAATIQLGVMTSGVPSGTQTVSFDSLSVP